MRALPLLLLLAGCPNKTPATNDAATTSSVAAIASSAPVDAGRPKAKRLTARELLDRWNDAHVKHDGKALEDLYAPKVKFYGQTLSGKDCAAKKAAAFAKSPTYSQAVKDITASQDSAATTIQFTKTSIEKGKGTDYPSVLVVVDQLITAETDKITEANLVAKAASNDDWCRDSDHLPNDVVKAPYKLSAGDAYRRARLTKHFAEKEKALAPKFIDFGQFGCPATPCNAAVAGDCRYDMRLEDHSQEAFENPEPHSILIEWEYVDAATAIVYWNDGKDSEPLPPMPK